MKESFGIRLGKLMGTMTDKQLSEILKSEYRIDRSEQLVKKWRNNERTPSADIVLVLSEHFEVSADWLLGKDVPMTMDADVRKISAYTGLTEKAIRAMHYTQLPEKDRIESDVEVMNKRSIDFINRVFERINTRVKGREGLRPVDTLFSIMEDYVCSTDAWIEDKQTGEQQKIITVNYSSAPPFATTASAFVRGQLLSMVREMLETLRKENDDSESAQTKRKTYKKKARQKSSQGEEESK